ncbi:MAG: GGDEF domain-containing protein [Lachnospiraceae bacterium]|nr:GGDEF domain-containing protein [Lachnospiraceae bacterium]
MDFQKFADGFGPMTCVVSVDRLPNDDYDNVRIVAGNKGYVDSIEHPMGGVEMLTRKFVPNTPYTDYLPKDLNFEDACYRAAIKKKVVHAYAHPDRFDVWFNMTFMPVEYEDGDTCYCTYTMEINFEPDTDRMSNMSSGLASQVLSTCLKLRGTEDFKFTMNDIIKDIRNLCGASSCVILLMDTVQKTCELLAEDIDESSVLMSIDEYIQDGFYTIAETWEDTIAGSNCIIAKNQHEMDVIKERNPVWYKSLKEAAVDTVVLFPLKARGELLGYIWAANFDPDKAPIIKETLEITTFILASEIGNYLLLDRLKILSSVDMLTGVLNRNEMNNLVDSLCTGIKGKDKSAGVVFADLNGLKTVNDEQGHPAGDALLKRAAATLRTVFGDEEIFRAGGDEFSMILIDVTEEEVAKKVEQVRKNSKDFEDVNFAIGFSVVNKAKDVRKALRKADENMYEDKRLYYEAHPDKRRGTLKDDFRFNVEDKPAKAKKGK